MHETLHADEVRAEELEQVEHLVKNFPQGSAFTVFLQSVISDVRKGKDVAYADLDKPLTPNEAAALLGMSRPHLLKLLRAGQIDGDMVGTHHKIPMSEVLAFIDRREQAKAVVASAYGTAGVVEKGLRDGAGQLSDEDREALDAL